MKRKRPPDTGDGPVLDPAERARLSTMLDSVGTHTLLNSLTGLDRDSDDARLIIAALMNRLPAQDDVADEGGPGAGQAPVIPI